jgi:hypothetical protein
MAKLRQITYHDDVLVEEAELTEEQVKLFKENEDEFVKNHVYALDWDYVNEWRKYDDTEYELIEDEEE